MNAIELRDDVMRRQLIDYGYVILKENMDEITCGTNVYDIVWDTTNNNWYKEKDMLDELKKELGQIRATQGQLDNLKSRFEIAEKKVETLDRKMSNYVECEETGMLVHKDMAQSFSVLSSDYVPRRYNLFKKGSFLGFTYREFLGIEKEREEDVAYTVYLCNFVDMKKFKKANNIK